jgi:hypothetical protein
MIDNAFGPRRDPGFRLFRKCYDLVQAERRELPSVFDVLEKR